MKRSWALLRLTTEYIEENTAKWEKEKLEREQDEMKRLKEWDEMTRSEKIASFNKEKNKDEKNCETTENKWVVWRTTEKKRTMPEEKHRNILSGEKVTHEKPKLEMKKLRSPKLIAERKPPEKIQDSQPTPEQSKMKNSQKLTHI